MNKIVLYCIDKSKKLKCRLLQFLFGALRVNNGLVELTLSPPKSGKTRGHTQIFAFLERKKNRLYEYFSLSLALSLALSLSLACILVYSVSCLVRTCNSLSMDLTRASLKLQQQRWGRCQKKIIKLSFKIITFVHLTALFIQT